MITIFMPLNIIKDSLVIYLYTMKHNLHSSSSPWPFPLLSLAQITLASRVMQRTRCSFLTFGILKVGGTLRWYFSLQKDSMCSMAVEEKKITSNTNICFNCMVVSFPSCTSEEKGKNQKRDTNRQMIGMKRDHTMLWFMNCFLHTKWYSFPNFH